LETVEIQAEPRDPGKKGRVKSLRRDGKIPAVFYGPKTETVSLGIGKREFVTRVAGLEGSHLIRFQSASPLLANKVALVKEMQFHPVTEDVVHVDFYEVDLAEKILVKVPLHFVGKAEGVVRGGILQPVVREIEVECLPMEIPEYVNVEVTSLDIGHSLHVEDVVMPSGVVALYETNFTLVTVVPPTVEEAAPAAEAPAAAAEGAEIPEGAPQEKKKEEGSGS
jgi:large subunit ribosomal protein L25